VTDIFKQAVLASLICCEDYEVQLQSVYEVDSPLPAGDTAGPPAVVFNYTVKFRYTEFNFADATAAYNLMSEELMATVAAGGFQQNWKNAYDTNDCYYNFVESSGGKPYALSFPQHSPLHNLRQHRRSMTQAAVSMP
jgi:hypothetical protein